MMTSPAVTDCEGLILTSPSCLQEHLWVVWCGNSFVHHDWTQFGTETKKEFISRPITVLLTKRLDTWKHKTKTYKHILGTWEMRISQFTQMSSFFSSYFHITIQSQNPSPGHLLISQIICKWLEWKFLAYDSNSRVKTYNFHAFGTLRVTKLMAPKMRKRCTLQRAGTINILRSQKASTWGGDVCEAGFDCSSKSHCQAIEPLHSTTHQSWFVFHE